MADKPLATNKKRAVPENDVAAGSVSKLQNLTKGIDFTIDVESGFMIFTSDYLLRRGHCCQSSCRNCPYGFTPNT